MKILKALQYLLSQQSSKIVILDEAAMNFDSQNMKKMFQVIFKKKLKAHIQVFMISHSHHSVEWFNHFDGKCFGVTFSEKELTSEITLMDPTLNLPGTSKNHRCKSAPGGILNTTINIWTNCVTKEKQSS